jgi:hypothetical protein
MSDRPTHDEEAEDRLGLNPEQWAWFQEYTRGYGDQDENGVDLSLLRENLNLSPTERVQKMLQGLRLKQEMEHAGRVAGLRTPAQRS